MVGGEILTRSAPPSQQEQRMGRVEASWVAWSTQVYWDRVMPVTLGSILWILKGKLSLGGLLLECATSFGPSSRAGVSPLPTGMRPGLSEMTSD